MDIIEGPIGQELNYILGKLSSRTNDLKRLGEIQEGETIDDSQEEDRGAGRPASER